MPNTSLSDKISMEDYPQLGLPQWHNGDTPPTSQIFPGAVNLKTLSTFRSGHSTLRSLEDVQFCTVLYSSANTQVDLPKYFNQAKITGEVHLNVKKPTHIHTIEVWLIGISDSNLRPDHTFLQCHADLWNKPVKAEVQASLDIEHDKFPVGSYVFPFEFEELPQYTRVNISAHGVHKHGDSAWAFLPPSVKITHNLGYSGQVTYQVWTNVEYGLLRTPVTSASPIVYFPRMRSLPKTENTFPRGIVWPLQREVIDGWSLTPFGGRGNLHGTAVEIEGLVGVKSPSVYGIGEQVDFVLLLRSTSQTALQALSTPDHINAVFMSSDIFGPDALEPGNAAKNNRELQALGQAKIWINNEDNEATYEGKNVVRLDGNLTVPAVLPPSFRYELIGREYLIKISITHPDYSHQDLETEAPLWIVTDPPQHASSMISNEPEITATQDKSKIPIIGDTLTLRDFPKKAPPVTGKATSVKERPTFINHRLVTF
ncbi:hypothetical protein M422DRAFT_270354 [Sphaerobolus stellatus SS14]|uniref:Arrestin-like N-terminal domain-containing protein n=1 Tax=Sphaerobolus stellatus (strain SS14) TaxID=990650 RepID=A0A0C9UHD6_SPHS4|nr:hypothetical protein M422DRAFT_270354 [Sphaerobolus stellatus SS14]